MKIKGIDGLTEKEINKAIERGGKFVIYSYAISIIVMTFKQSSDIYFIREGESAFSKGLGFSLLTVLLGWWGIPWGPIYSIGSLYTNLSGGKNVTQEVIQMIKEPSSENK